ncbi:MAG: hypothetical protein C0622_03715 [Desulfuromonas sp.]|nr:MAG: hypothetical protein C0622_03715 [Desulfuromonas sp.]
MNFAIRKKPFIVLVLFLTLFTSLLIGSSCAEIYRWRDDQGRIHFSDSLHDVPQHLREKTRDNGTTYETANVFSSGDQGGQVGARSDGNTLAGNEETISIPFTDKEGLADRVIIDITFNGTVTAPIMVDTGSPGLVLSASLAAQLGLIDYDGDNMLVLIGGIGGTQVAARAIVDEIKIDSIRERFIPAHIISDSSAAYQGLIGMDILSQYSLTINASERRLIAIKLPPSPNRPGGRNQSWWQRNFRELVYYTNFWDKQAELVSNIDGPYTVATSSSERIKEFILTQQRVTHRLYDKLENYARQNSVPRHWRK